MTVRHLFVTCCAALVLATAQTASAGLGDCGQPLSSGERPTASDALYILRTAVDLEDCTATGQPCICDVNSTGSATASDALVVLQVAVDLPVVLACAPGCPAGDTTTTTTTTVTTSSSSSTSLSSTSTSSTSLGASIEAGRSIYDADCASCHKATPYDLSGFASDLKGKAAMMVVNFGIIDEAMEGLTYSPAEVADLAAFINSL
jgi:hypothetical protein